jgi:hypothetical protein
VATENFNLPEGRLSYPNILKPRLNKLSNKMEYSVDIYLPPGTDIGPIKKQFEAACIDKWGPDKSRWPKNLRLPLKRMEDKMKDGSPNAGLEPGGYVLATKNERPPAVVDAQVQKVLDPNKVYGGVWAIVCVRAFAYAPMGVNPGISLSLQAVQIVRDGEPFGGGGPVKPESVFVKVGGGSAGASTNTPASDSNDDIFGV